MNIPEGSFNAGSRPGEPGRNPELEPRRVAIELGPFEIDRLPYPNDPKVATVTGVTRDEAKRLCAERGQRLCTELEWERACKGAQSQDYAAGSSWQALCASEPYACASGFGVLGLGGALREWVASDLPTKGEERARALLRGAAGGAAPAEHRCAARHALDAATKADDLGFRCCAGAPNAAVIPEPKPASVFTRGKLSAARLEELFKADPHTLAIAKEIRFFRDPDAANTVVARGPGDKKGFSFGVAPLLWRPALGTEFLLVSGRSGETTSFVAAFYALGEDDYALASSFVMKGEPGPVAFAYSDSIRPRLHFSTCWGCPGETGKILFRPPESLVILQP